MPFLRSCAKRVRLPLVLANLPADSQTANSLRDIAGKHSLHVFIRPAYLCSQVELGPESGRQELKIALAGKEKTSPLSARDEA